MTRFDPNDPLLGRARAERAADQVAQHNRDRAETVAALAAMNHGGGTSAPPASPPAQPAPVAAPHDVAALRADNAQVAATPRVRADANRLGVRLSTVTGTGTGGRITVDDVRAAVPRPTAASVGARRTERRSVFVWAQMVAVDEYGTNPLAEDLAQTLPEKYTAALRAGDRPPTLFESGDLPVFTASGIQLGSLAAVPWPARHVIARIPVEDAAYLLNKFTPGPTSDREALAVEAMAMFINDVENQAYKARLANWFDQYQPTGGGGFAKRDPRVWVP